MVEAGKDWRSGDCGVGMGNGRLAFINIIEQDQQPDYTYNIAVEDELCPEYNETVLKDRILGKYTSNYR